MAIMRGSRLGVALVALLLLLLSVSCAAERETRPATRAARTAAALARSTPTTSPPPTTTAAAREHWKLQAPCTTDGTTTRGGNAIVAVWDQTIALDCGVLLDTSTGARRGRLAADSVLTLADGTVLGTRTVERDATNGGGREYVTVGSSGRPGAVWGLLPRNLLTQPNVTWVPVLERGVFVGIPKQTWAERDRASAASPSGPAPGALRIFDSSTGELRTIDPALHLGTEANDTLRWWVVDGQLLLSSRRRGVVAMRASDLTTSWSLSPELLNGRLVAEATDFGRLGVLPVQRADGEDVLGLDVRTGSVLLSPRSADLVEGDVQFTMTGDYAVLHQMQMFVNNGFATAIRDGQKLWSYPDVKGPCDFAKVTTTSGTGLVMACGSFVAYQRA